MDRHRRRTQGGSVRSRWRSRFARASPSRRGSSTRAASWSATSTAFYPGIECLARSTSGTRDRNSPMGSSGSAVPTPTEPTGSTLSSPTRSSGPSRSSSTIPRRRTRRGPAPAHGHGPGQGGQLRRFDRSGVPGLRQPLARPRIAKNSQARNSSIEDLAEFYANVLGSGTCTSRTSEPGAQGEFTLESMIPGACFYVTAARAETARPQVPAPDLKPGEVRDLGTLVLKERTTVNAGHHVPSSTTPAGPGSRIGPAPRLPGTRRGWPTSIAGRGWGQPGGSSSATWPRDSSRRSGVSSRASRTGQAASRPPSSPRWSRPWKTRPGGGPRSSEPRCSGSTA